MTPRSHHPSAEIGGLGLRDLTSNFRYSGGGYGGGGGGGLGAPPRTPRERRQHSAGSESINVFADPSTVGSGTSGGYRDTAYTTWTNIMADGERTPGLPDSPTRRR